MLKFKDINQITVRENCSEFHDMFGIPYERWKKHVKKHREMDDLDMKKHIIVAYEDSESAQEFVAVMCLIFHAFGHYEGAKSLMERAEDLDPMSTGLLKALLRSDIKQTKKN